METEFSNKLNILSDLWMNYRSEAEFADFVEYNDIGLPMAYCIQSGIVKGTDMSTKFIEETFALLLAGLDIEDTGFETLDDVLGA